MHDNMTKDFLQGSESWDTDRDYTQGDLGRDPHLTVDNFFSYLKTTMIDEGIVIPPRVHDRSSTFS